MVPTAFTFMDAPGRPCQPHNAPFFDMITLPPPSMLVVAFAFKIGFVTQGVGLLNVVK